MRKRIEITKTFEKLVLNFCEANFQNIIDRTDDEKHPWMPDIEIENEIYIECTVAMKGESSDGLTFQLT